jgi:hypothetical protein
MTTATTNRYVDDAVTGGENPDDHSPQLDKIVVVMVVGVCLVDDVVVLGEIRMVTSAVL